MNEKETITEIMRKMELATNAKIELVNIKQATMGEKLTSIEKSVNRIEEHLENFIHSAPEKFACKKTEFEVDNLESDIKDIKAYKNKAMGVVAVLVVVVSILVTFLGKVMDKYI